MTTRIGKLRRQLGLTQDQLARMTGINVRTIQNYEGGASKPIPLYRQALEKVLGAKAGDEDEQS